jgi:hypothetical protein
MMEAMESMPITSTGFQNMGEAAISGIDSMETAGTAAELMDNLSSQNGEMPGDDSWIAGVIEHQFPWQDYALSSLPESNEEGDFNISQFVH